MTPKLVSIVLPNYNRVALLPEAVASVQAQTYANWQLIIVDDGSDDGGPEWVRSLEDERITLIELSHCGRPARVRNAGLACAAGDYIAFLDSDDRWRADKIELQMGYHQRPGSARWSYTGRRILDADGHILSDSGFRPWQALEGQVFLDLLRHDAMISLPTVAVERRLLNQVGGFDESLPLCEDYDLWLRLAEATPCGVLTQPLTDVRVHAASTTYDQPAVNASFMTVYARVAASTGSAEVRKICRDQRAKYAVHLARQQVRRRRPARALRALATALRARPASLPAWRVLAALALRTLRLR